MNRVGCAVLAAGGSRRLDARTQPTPHPSVPLVRRAAETACASTCDEIAVIVGDAYEEIHAALAGLRATVVYEPAWAGLGRTVRAAAQWGRRRALSALVLVACDQPLLEPEHLDALVAEHALGAERVVSTYGGVRGAPAIFDSSWFDELRALASDRDVGALLRSHSDVQEVPWEGGASGVDTPLRTYAPGIRLGASRRSVG